VGVYGEICLAGEGLAKGYLNRPELTAARFVPNVAGDGTGMYRTGDRGRWRPDGEVEFLGRTDNQVKLHGHRIEPGEIEDVLRNCPGVGQAVVTVHEPRENDKELVAYLVADGELSQDAVRQFVGRHVAPYMVPSRFVRMTALPMTANGKVDRNALSPGLGVPLDPGSQRGDAPQPAPAPSDLEKQIDALVRQVIRVDEVGPTRNLFEHGLTSIRVVALHQLLNDAYPGGLDIHDIFSNPSVRQLTQLLGRRLEPAPAPPVPHTEEIEF
jgi:aryl carrier-like protein